MLEGTKLTVSLYKCVCVCARAGVCMHVCVCVYLQASVWQLLLLGDNWHMCTCAWCACATYVNLMMAEYIYTSQFFSKLLPCFRMLFHMIGNKWLQGQISLSLQPVNHSETAQKLPASCYYKVESAQFPCYFSHHLQEDYVHTLSSKLTMWGDGRCGQSLTGW